MAYGTHVVQQNLNFDVNRGDIFFVVGGSGCGKTTLLKNMIGLIKPVTGEVLYDGVSFYQADAATQSLLLKKWGITYQSGALFSSMTLAENVALPIQQYTDLTEKNYGISGLQTVTCRSIWLSGILSR